MEKNNYVVQLMKNIRILPIRERGRGEIAYQAYVLACKDLGLGEEYIFGKKEMPATKGKYDEGKSN